MIVNASRYSFPQFPLKKILLLLWKTLLVTLGDAQTLARRKVAKRLRAGLVTQYENSIEVAKTLNVVDVISLEDGDGTLKSTKSEEGIGKPNDECDSELSRNDAELPEWDVTESANDDDNDGTSFRMKTVPWKVKAYKNEVDNIVDGINARYFYYNLNDDNEVFDELPLPVEEVVKTLRKNMYVSLADLQIQNEIDAGKTRSRTDGEIEMTPAEIIYHAMLPKLKDYMNALLEILLCVTSTVHEKFLVINIITEIVPESLDVRESTFNSREFAVDVNRHFEIVAKAVSSIILLLLKHFRLNHVYQFEHLAQQLVFARAIPSFLKFLNQDVAEHVNVIDTIPELEFPRCVITKHSYRARVSPLPSYRNLFTLINVIRILVKLIKGKPCRIKVTSIPRVSFR